MEYTIVRKRQNYTPTWNADNVYYVSYQRAPGQVETLWRDACPLPPPYQAITVGG